MLVALALASCADFDPPVPGDHGLPDEIVPQPSFAADIQPIFTARCATSSCHTVGTRQADLVLAPEHSYDDLVGVASTLVPQVLRVAPADPDHSLLLTVLSDTSERLNIPRMPLGLSPLRPNQIITIANWIRQGAPRN